MPRPRSRPTPPILALLLAFGFSTGLGVGRSHAARVEAQGVFCTASARVEISLADGALSLSDTRTGRVWKQTRVEEDAVFRQELAAFFPERNEIHLTCTLAGVRADGRRAPVPARIVVHVEEDRPELSLTFVFGADARSAGAWRQAAYPYVMARDGERVSNLFPHGEGMLVPVRKSDPDWIALPDGDHYGGVHSYLMCLGLVDEANGEGLLTLLPDIEATLLKWREVPVAEQTVLAPELVCRSNRGDFDRAWHFSYCFSPGGGYVALAKRYREFFAALGLHKTLRQKAGENAAVHEILGAPAFWANTRTPKLAADMADAFRSAGVDRCLFAMCNVPLHNPAVPDWEEQTARALQRVRALGFHTYRYDQYRDAFEPDPSRPHTHQINTNAWPDKLVLRENGTRVAAFGPQSGIVCANFFLPLALETFEREFRNYAYSARFLDCLGSVGFNMEAECFDPRHPCDRYFTRQQRTALLVELNKRGILASTECGIDYLLPQLHWVEGASTLVRWKEFFPASERKENAGINAQAGGAGSERYRALNKLEPTARVESSLSISPRYRVPFYSLCHHDEVIVTWRWEDGMDDPAVYWPLKNLWSVLTGSPPMYRMTAERVATFGEQIGRTQRYVSSWAKQVAFDVLINHRFLTQDRLVQETEFSSGQGVVINLGERPFSLGDGQVVRPRDCLFFQCRQPGGPREWQPPPCPNVFAH